MNLDHDERPILWPHIATQQSVRSYNKQHEYKCLMESVGKTNMAANKIYGEKSYHYDCFVVSNTKQSWLTFSYLKTNIVIIILIIYSSYF